MSEENLKPVSIIAKAENTKEALVISYEVENHTNEIMYLWDLLVDYSSSEPKLDRKGAYVFFEEPGTVRVIRAVLPLPEAFDIGRKPIPYARVLDPNGKLTGTITLKHPVREVSPYYGPPTEEEKKTVKVSKIQLLIGWTAPKSGMKIEERTVGGEKAIAIRGAWEPPYQRVLEAEMTVETELVIYTSQFERMLPFK